MTDAAESPDQLSDQPSVAPAEAGDVPEAAAVLAEAFLHDPVMLDIFPGTENRRERLEDLFVAIVSTAPLHTGALDVARLAPAGPVVGVAVWEAPRRPRGASGRVPVVARLRALPRYLRSVGWRRVPHVLRRLRVLEAQRPKVPHWYLAEIAVAPGGQGRGVGSALLRHGLERADGDRRLAYLEASTPGSRRLYERFGFRPSGTLAIGGDPTPMVRPARSGA